MSCNELLIQAVGAEQRKARFAKSVLVNGLSSSGAVVGCRVIIAVPGIAVVENVSAHVFNTSTHSTFNACAAKGVDQYISFSMN